MIPKCPKQMSSCLVYYYVSLSLSLHSEITAVVTPSSSSSPTLVQTGFSLTCDVSGTENLNSPTLTYEWQRNGSVLSNQQERTLSLSPLSGSHVGEYVCKVTVNSTLLSSVEMRTSGTHTVSAQSKSVEVVFNLYY